MQGIIIARKAAGLTQAELAAKVGVCRTAVAAWESGKSYPPADRLPAIAAALSCTVDDLYNTSVNPKKGDKHMSKEAIEKAISSICDRIVSDAGTEDGYTLLPQMTTALALLVAASAVADALSRAFTQDF